MVVKAILSFTKCIILETFTRENSARKAQLNATQSEVVFSCVFKHAKGYLANFGGKKEVNESTMLREHEKNSLNARNFKPKGAQMFHFVRNPVTCYDNFLRRHLIQNEIMCVKYQKENLFRTEKYPKKVLLNLRLSLLKSRGNFEC